MVGRGVKRSRQCCEYGCGGRHVPTHTIICPCPCPPLFVHPVVHPRSCPPLLTPLRWHCKHSVVAGMHLHTPLFAGACAHPCLSMCLLVLAWGCLFLMLVHTAFRACLTSTHSHSQSYLFALVCPCLCSFGVVCACSAFVRAHLHLSSLSFVPVSNLWLVHHEHTHHIMNYQPV